VGAKSGTIVSARLEELRAALADAIARGDEAAEVEIEAAIMFVEQAEASVPAFPAIKSMRRWS
jgi:hypothetical protein